MENISLWLKDNPNKNPISLNEDIKTDVLIIGGGITGLSILYNLKDSNLNVTLVDTSLVGTGTTGHTTGKINYLQEDIYQKLINTYSFNTALSYLNSQKDACNKILDIINKEQIKCNLDKVESYVYTNDINKIEKLKKEKEYLQALNVHVEDYQGKFGKIKSLYAIKVNDTYVFHPLKYLNALKDICLKSGKKIYENTKIIKIIKENDLYSCFTNSHKIITIKIVFACHYPFFKIPYLFPIKANIEKSYLMALPMTKENKSLISIDKVQTSIRYHKDKEEYLIYLSLNSNISDNLDEKKNYHNLIKKLNKKPKYIWKNTDIMTIDKLPYIGRIKKNNDNLLIATGYNTCGMTNGTLAGLIISDILLNRHNKYENLCNPLRLNKLTNIDDYILNLLYSMKGYLKSKINKNKSWYSSKVSFKYINGENIGIYKENGKEFKVRNKCPHMGCSLIFNEFSKTWDCPCHASRFSKEGKCLKGPSKFDITCIE